MKMKDIMPEAEAKDFDDCILCEVHKRAYSVIPQSIVCPYCGHNNYISVDNEYEVVGETNYYEPDQKINKYPVFACEECGEHSALIPEKINFNGNHGVYYTGGRDYLNDDDEGEIFLLAQKKIETSLNQWKTRIAAGEQLDSFFPALWIKRDITHAIAEYLYQKGFKK